MQLRFVYFVVTFLYVSALAGPAHAYLDGSTGTILVQLLLGGAAGAAALLKLYWHRIRSLFSSASADPIARDSRRP